MAFKTHGRKSRNNTDRGWLAISKDLAIGRFLILDPNVLVVKVIIIILFVNIIKVGFI